MEERERFVRDALSDRYTMSALCARYGVSRRIGYVWFDEVDHVREAMHERHANVIEHHWKLLRPFLDRGVRAAYLVGERIAESGAMRLVPLEGGDNISFGSTPNKQARRHAPRVFNS